MTNTLLAFTDGLHAFFKIMISTMLHDLDEEGGKLTIPSQYLYKGTKRQVDDETLDLIEEFMEEFGWAFFQIEKGKRQIVHDGDDLVLKVIPYLVQSGNSTTGDPDVHALILKIKDRMLDRIADDIMPSD
jgi:hypothetical protein